MFFTALVITMDLNEKELYADSIEFSYRAGQALLTGVHLSVKVGEVVALLGRNGCGKSTLMKVIFGTLKPKNAYIRLNGQRIQQAFATREVSYLPQERFLPTHKTVDQMIRFMLDDAEKRTAVAEDDVISKLLGQKIADLSVGEQRYLELCLLLHQKTTFLLLDEPFSGVSPYLKERIQEMILSFRHEKGIVLSDHHYQSVLGIATRMILMENGGCRQVQDKKDLEFFYLPEGVFDHEN